MISALEKARKDSSSQEREKGPDSSASWDSVFLEWQVNKHHVKLYSIHLEAYSLML
jgi:hypothetical protein